MTSHNHVKSVQRPDNESVDWNFSHYRNAQAIMLRWCDYRGMDVIPGYFLVVLGNQVTHRVDNAVNIAEVQTHWQEWNEEKNRGFNVHYLFKVKLKVIVIRIFLQLLQLICLYTETKQFNNPLHMLILLVFSSHLSFFNDWCTTPVARSCGGAPKKWPRCKHYRGQTRDKLGGIRIVVAGRVERRRPQGQPSPQKEANVWALAFVWQSRHTYFGRYWVAFSEAQPIGAIWVGLAAPKYACILGAGAPDRSGGGALSSSF